MRIAPPVRTSISQTGFANPFGPHHCATCVDSVHALKTSARGASNTRLITRSHSEESMLPLCFASPLLPALIFALSADMPALLRFRFQILVSRVFSLQFLQIVSQPVKALLPESPVMFHPSGNVLQRTGLQPARPPLRLAPARNQPGA